MADGKLASVAVLEIGDPIIPILAGMASQIGTRQEYRLAGHLELDLEGEGLVLLLIGRGRAPVYQEDGNRAGAWRQSRIGRHRPHRTREVGHTQAVARWHLNFARLLGSLRQIYSDVDRASRTRPLFR